MSISAEEIRLAIAKLRESAIKPTPCPKCGKSCYVAYAGGEAGADLAAAGYDGTCCWPGFDYDRPRG